MKVGAADTDSRSTESKSKSGKRKEKMRLDLAVAGAYPIQIGPALKPRFSWIVQNQKICIIIQQADIYKRDKTKLDESP